MGRIGRADGGAGSARGRTRSSTSASSWSSTAPTSSATHVPSAATTPTPRTSPRARWCARSASGARLREPERAKWYLLRIVRNLATDQARARARVSVEPWADVPDEISVELEPEALVLRGRRPARSRAPRSPICPEPPGGAAPPLRRRARLRSGRGAAPHHRARGAQRVYRAMQALRTVAQRLQLASGRELAKAGQPASSARAPISTDGWRRRASARASIWRTRSRLRLTSWPTSSGVRGSPRSSPKRSVRM